MSEWVGAGCFILASACLMYSLLASSDRRRDWLLGAIYFKLSAIFWLLNQ